MRKIFNLNSDEAMTLIFLAKLNEDIIDNGLTKDNTDAFLKLQIELVEIVNKITYH